MRTMEVVLTLLISALMIIVPITLDAEDGEAYDILPTRELSTDLIFDQVLEVPPGGETRIIVGADGKVSTEGYTGVEIDPVTKLAIAADLLPEWLRDDFIKNMLSAARRPVTNGEQTSSMIPAFGDLDADGDDDLVIGINGELRFYENIGSQGNPIYSSSIWDNWYNEIPCDSVFVSPSLMDIDSDGYAEIIWGDDTENLNIIYNRGIGTDEEIGYMISALGYITSNDPPTHISPAPATGDNNTFRTYFGCRQGHLYYWDMIWEYQGEDIDFTFTNPPARMQSMGMGNFSSPRLWKHGRANAEYHNIVGMSIGSSSGLMKYHPLVDGHYENPDPEFFRNVLMTGQVTPVPCYLNGDGTIDMVLGTSGPSIPWMVNYGVQPAPYWAPDPHIPAFEIENYASAFDESLSIFQVGRIEEYLDLIISPPDPRYRDEIGFACAFTPPLQLTNNRLSSMLLENVRYIYGRDSELEYVRIIEKGGPDPYTTTSYRVREGEKTREREISRDAYYWGIVHPRVTEERVAYIEPETGNEVLPEDGGRYWREYLYEHADDEYPPGPDFPDDWEGRRVYYPRDHTPPLLKEVLEDVDIFWDLQPYEYPAGFDHQGKNNSHPWDYRDHALEKVSHWVEKTLVLNQQESPDEERPNQPVRIAHGHNGNCGELQDLTIAGARSALIPARGVHLPGEDHVWSEFYLGGWHQWDNYWSDGGGVVANDLNYWWGWGRRGGSGVWASDGAGQSFDVGSRYRSPDVSGSLGISVRDTQGRPVEGARVVVMSHWAMENAIDPGEYQGPIPTIPLPSIWGYTDSSGDIDFKVWGQSFNFRVTSDLGTYVSEKFTMEDDSDLGFLVEMQSDKPVPEGYMPRSTFDSDGRRYMLSVEVLDSYQYQNELTSGVLLRNVHETGRLYTNIYSEKTLPSWGPISSDEVYHTSPLAKAFYNNGWNMTIALADMNTLNTYTRARVKIYEMSGDQVDEPDLLVINPNGKKGEGFEPGSSIGLKGFLLVNESIYPDGVPGINLRSSVMEHAGVIEDDPNFPGGVLSWEVREVLGEPGTIEQMSFDLLDDQGGVMDSLPISVKIVNNKGPMWYELVGNGTKPWGAEYDIGFQMYSHWDVRSLLWMDYDEMGILDPVQAEYPKLNMTTSIDSSEFSSGSHKIRMTSLDDAGNIRNLVFNVNFEPSRPTMDIGSPSQGQTITGDTLEVRGRFQDDVEISSLVVTIDEQAFDITAMIDEQGRVSTDIEFKGVPGPINVQFNATDNVGLWNTTVMEIELLPPPDEDPPILRLDGPDDGQRFEKGEMINFRGIVVESSPMGSLSLSVGTYRADILDDLSGNTFTHSVSTERWSTGIKEVVLRGSDIEGNTASISMDVIIYKDEVEFVDLERPEITVDDPAQGSVYELGSFINIRGKVTDDSQDIKLYHSIDRGDSFQEVDGTFNNGLDFDFQVDTADILSTYELSPGQLRSMMTQQTVVLKAVDGTNRQRYHEVQVSIEDRRDPEVLSPSIEYSEVLDSITVSARFRDDSILDRVFIELVAEDGRRIDTNTFTGSDLGMDGDTYKLSWKVYGPFEPGEITAMITVEDAWENSATSSAGVVITETGEGEGADLGKLIFISFVIFVLIGPFLLYSVIKLLRRRGNR